jgi:UDP-N-acetylglucosamine--N-acetylmuramyl-(pentapeptide) pyrophosphoryl-undecaprenol N-acetylglucosamine transferase
VTCYDLPGAKLRRYFSVENILDVPRFFWALLKAFWRLWVLMPDVVYSKGGPGALPVVFAAWCYHIPVLVHDSDMIPGLTNRISSHFARRIAVSFEAAQQYFPKRKVAWTGHPQRRSMLQAGQSRESAKAHFGFLPAEPLILVIGGSQGSQRINEAMLGGLSQIAQVAAVLHQAGTANVEEATELARAGMLTVDGTVAARHPWKVFPYLAEMGQALLAADLVVSRSGSSSIFEIASFGRAAILVPLEESANDHQKANAVAFAQAGGGVVLEEANLIPSILGRLIAEILVDTPRRTAMEVASRAFSKDGGAEIIASELLRI